MVITDIKLRRKFDEGALLAVFSIIFDDALVVHDIKLINGREKLIVAMPNKSRGDGTFKDIAHPINAELRGVIEAAVLDCYNNYEPQVES